MQYLIIGSGGREHAIGWKLSQSTNTKKIYFAPGNGGTDTVGENIDINISDSDEIINFVKKNNIDITVIGPEIPLVEGLVDKFENNNLKAFGPNKYAAQLEGSKAFSKDFMKKYNIPTAKFKTFTNFEEAKKYIENGQDKVVVKASGLAAGKGAIVCFSKKEAINAIDEMMNQNLFGDSGNKVVIEEFMEGEEASIFVISDGKDYRILPPAQDHKRIGENDTGLNTGGMGAYTPAPVANKDVMQQIRKEIIEPTLNGMKQEGSTYKGLLYVGVMIKDNYAKTVEFNCRFGDPETQPVLYAMKEDLAPYIKASIEGTLASTKEISFDIEPTVCVVIASNGYPKSYKKGLEINIANLNNKNEIYFHAGTKKENNKLMSSGGRVLNIVVKSKTYQKAIDRANEIAENTALENKYYRRDIAHRVLNK